MLWDITFCYMGLPKVCSSEQTLIVTAAPCRKLRARAVDCFKCAPVSRLRRLTKPFQGLRARRTPCPTLRLGRALKLDGLLRLFSGLSSIFAALKSCQAIPENLRSTKRAWSSVSQPLANRKLLGACGRSTGARSFQSPKVLPAAIIFLIFYVER
jgi:hypothetical protein